MAARAGESEGVLVRELEAAAVGPVEGPGVVSLVADWEGPRSGGLADQVHQIARVVGGEVGNVVVVGRFGLGRVIDGGLTGIGVEGPVCSCGPAGREPWENPKVGQRVKAVGSSNLCGVDVGFRELVQIVDTTICAVFCARRPVLVPRDCGPGRRWVWAKAFGCIDIVVKKRVGDVGIGTRDAKYTGLQDLWVRGY